MLEENKDTKIPTMKYRKSKDWSIVRNELFSIINAFEPTIVDNTEQVRNMAIDIIESEVANAQSKLNHFDAEKQRFTINSIEAEGYLRGCMTCLEAIKEYL